MTIAGSLEHRGLDADWRRGSQNLWAETSRTNGALQVNLNFPLSKHGAKGTGIGALSLNANLELERYSDFGAQTTITYGLNWSPLRSINFIASATNEQIVPTVEQLGAPRLVSPNVRMYDFLRREVVDIALVTGGNRDLDPEQRKLFRLGLTVTPLAATDLTLSIDYSSATIERPIASFPVGTPAIEAAFPERFARDGSGRLTEIDGRSLNFLRSRLDRIRWGINFVRPLGAVEPWMRNAPVRVYTSEEEARSAARPGTIVSMVQPGSAMARRLDNMSSRAFVSIYHSWTLRDEIVVRPGFPELDLLGGAAIDSRARRRHSLEFQAGVFKRGLGARLTANWQSGATVQGPGGEAGKLKFSNLATVSINLFANLEDRFGGKSPPAWLKGMRLTLGVTNLLNSRPEVRNAMGVVPLSYDPAYLDPVGRVVSLGLRKVF
jgi:hypothetical protein